jgi:hypothetical protein
MPGPKRPAATSAVTQNQIVLARTISRGLPKIFLEDIRPRLARPPDL